MTNLIEQLINISQKEVMPLFSIKGLEDVSCLHLYSKDSKGRYISSNDALAKAAGFENGGDLVGLSDYDICTKKVAGILQANDKKVMLKKIPIVYEESICTINGNQLSCISYKFPVTSFTQRNEGIIGFSILPDINRKMLFDIDIKRKIHYSLCHNLNFSIRQMEIAQLLIRAKTSKEIAKILRLSPRTIEQYIQAIKSKLKVSTRSELIDKLFDIFILY